MKLNPITLGRQALVQHLQTITVAGGWRTNAGHHVRAGWFNEVLESEKLPFPLIVVQRAKDLAPRPGPAGLIKMSGFYVVGAVSVGLDNYQDALDELEHDLLIALTPREGAPPKWLPVRGGVKGITVGAPEQFPPGNGEPAATVLVPVHLHTVIER